MKKKEEEMNGQEQNESLTKKKIGKRPEDKEVDGKVSTETPKKKGKKRKRERCDDPAVEDMSQKRKRKRSVIEEGYSKDSAMADVPKKKKKKHKEVAREAEVTLVDGKEMPGKKKMRTSIKHSAPEPQLKEEKYFEVVETGYEQPGAKTEKVPKKKKKKKHRTEEENPKEQEIENLPKKKKKKHKEEAKEADLISVEDKEMPRKKVRTSFEHSTPEPQLKEDKYFEDVETTNEQPGAKTEKVPKKKKKKKHQTEEENQKEQEIENLPKKKKRKAQKKTKENDEKMLGENKMEKSSETSFEHVASEPLKKKKRLEDDETEYEEPRTTEAKVPPKKMNKTEEDASKDQEIEDVPKKKKKKDKKSKREDEEMQGENNVKKCISLPKSIKYGELSSEKASFLSVHPGFPSLRDQYLLSKLTKVAKFLDYIMEKPEDQFLLPPLNQAWISSTGPKCPERIPIKKAFPSYNDSRFLEDDKRTIMKRFRQLMRKLNFTNEEAKDFIAELKELPLSCHNIKTAFAAYIGLPLLDKRLAADVFRVFIDMVKKHDLAWIKEEKLVSKSKPSQSRTITAKDGEPKSSITSANTSLNGEPTPSSSSANTSSNGEPKPSLSSANNSSDPKPKLIQAESSGTKKPSKTWTEEEIVRLMELVFTQAKFARITEFDAKAIDWNAVTEEMDGRSRIMVKRIWDHQVEPILRAYENCENLEVCNLTIVKTLLRHHGFPLSWDIDFKIVRDKFFPGLSTHHINDALRIAKRGAKANGYEGNDLRKALTVYVDAREGTCIKRKQKMKQARENAILNTYDALIEKNRFFSQEGNVSK